MRGQTKYLASACTAVDGHVHTAWPCASAEVSTYCKDQNIAAAGLGVTGRIRCGGAAGATVTGDSAVRNGGCDTIYRRRASGGRRYGVSYLCHQRRQPR